MHLTFTERYLFYFLCDKVTEYCNSFTILSIYCELATAWVLMQRNEWTSIWLCHLVKLLSNYVNRSCLNGVRVPKIYDIYNKFRIDILEKIVSMVMLVYVTLYIWGFLEEEISVRWSRLWTVHLSLADKLTARGGNFSDFNGLAVVHTYIALGLPLAFILVKPVEISRSIVQKHAVRRKAV